MSSIFVHRNSVEFTMGRGGYNAKTSCAMHCGSHRMHCPLLAVVSAPTPNLLLPREQVRKCC